MEAFIVVFFSAVMAFASVVAAFKGAEYADDHWRFVWPIPLLGFLALAVWLMGHALSLFLASPH